MGSMPTDETASPKPAVSSPLDTYFPETLLIAVSPQTTRRKNEVATAAGVPGIFIKITVLLPPYTAPTHIATMTTREK